MTTVRRHQIAAWIFITILPLAFNACGQGFSASSVLKPNIIVSGGSSQVSLAWAANHESAVNAAGGGYRVFYSSTSDVSTSSPSIEVPYVSGTLAPTSVGLDGFSPGIYYARIQAFSSANRSGSALSSSIQFTVQQ